MIHRSALRSFACLAACSVALTLPAAAQWVQTTPCTAGWHVWGAPYWTDNVPDPASLSGTVTQLDFVYWLEMHAALPILQPGTYVAQVRIACISPNLPDAMDVRALSNNGLLGSRTWSVAEQPTTSLGTYVWTPELVFTVLQPGQVDIEVSNVGGNPKAGYRFDSVRIGRVPIGRVEQHQSLDTWAWANDPWFNHNVTEAGAVYGAVTEQNAQALWWLNGQGTLALPAGTFVLNARLRNRSGVIGQPFVCGATPVTLHAFAGTNSWLATLPDTAQPQDVWVYTPDVVVTLAAPTVLTVEVFDYTNVCKGGYQFDSLAVRPTTPSFTAYGAACGGITLTNPVAATLGGALTLRTGGAGPLALAGLFAFGTPVPSVPLDPIGMIGCQLHVTPDALLVGAPNGPGTFDLVVAVPNSMALLGLGLDAQGATLDASAPGSIYTANAGLVTIGR